MSGNKQWAIQIPALANVQSMDPTRVRLPTGPYAVLITESEQTSKDGAAGSIRFDCTVTEAGEHKGRVVSVYQGLDFSKDGNQKSFKALLESIGAPPQVFMQSANVGAQSFNGKQAYIFVQAAPEGEKDAFDNRNFVSPTIYQREKAKLAASAATGGQPQVGSALPTQPVQQQLAQPPAFGGGVPQPSNGVAQLGTAIGQPVAAPPAPPAQGGLSF